MRAIVLTLDLDGAHAAGPGTRDAPDAVVAYGTPLERFAELCGGLGAPATLFVATADLDRGAGGTLRSLVARGLEVACLSRGHGVTRSAAVVRAEVARARRAVEDAVGVAPAGFRVPGRELDAALLDVLEEQGFAYDSSVVPSPPAHVATAVARAAAWLAGARPAPSSGSPRLAIAPRRPYRPGPLPYTPGPRELWELPVTVATPLGLPIGAALLSLAPSALRDACVRSLASSEVVVLRLHAADLAGARAGDPPSGARPARDESWGRRRNALLESLRALGSGREALTAAGLVARLAAARAAQSSSARSHGGATARRR